MSTKSLDSHKQAIAASFSKAANSYDNFAIVEQEIGKRLLQRLEFIKIQPRYILDLGCGTGFFTKQLQELYPQAIIIGIDIAFGMVKIASSNHQEYCCADAEQLPFESQQFDLIFSNCCMPSISNPTNLFAEIQRVLTTDGLLLFTTWGPDTLYELGIELNTHEMHQIGDILLKQQYKNPVVDTEKLIFSYNKLQTLLEDLQYSGSFDIDFAQVENLIEPCNATFEVVYGHAWNQANKKQFTDLFGNTYIPLTELKIL